MRKAALLLIIVILSLSVVGCKAKKDLIKFDYEYEGENNSWESKYTIVGTGEFYKQGDGTLKYKGDIDRILEVTYKNDISELSSIKELEISYKAMDMGSSLKINFDKAPTEKTYVLSTKSSSYIYEKDKVIEVEIDIDGEVQIIELNIIDN